MSQIPISHFYNPDGRWMMKISAALGLGYEKSGILISFVGGGGKTSSIFALAAELAKERKRVLITTTTAIYNPEEIKNPYITVLGDHVTQEGKLKGITKEQVDQIYREHQYDVILVEADGSRGLPIKAPADYEPVIPSETDILVGIIGMDCYNKQVSPETVQRTEIFTDVAEVHLGDRIDEKAIGRLVYSPRGLYKNCPPKARKVLLLNKVFHEKLMAVSLQTGNHIRDGNREIDRILIGAVQEKDPIKTLL